MSQSIELRGSQVSQHGAGPTSHPLQRAGIDLRVAHGGMTVARAIGSGIRPLSNAIDGSHPDRQFGARRIAIFRASLVFKLQ